MELFMLLFATIFVNNIAFTQPLGIGNLLDFTNKPSSAWRIAVAFVAMVFTASFGSYLIYHYVLSPLGLIHLDLIVYTLVLYVSVKFVQKLLVSRSDSFESVLEQYFPLLACNSIALYVMISSVSSGLSVSQALVYALATPLGYAMIIYIVAAIRERLEYADIPAAFKGYPIALVVAATMAAAFTSFVGLF